MKNSFVIYIFFCLCTLYSCTNTNNQNVSEESKNHLEKMQLNGKIVSIQTTIYQAVVANNRIVKGKIIGDRMHENNIKFFNKYGNVSEERFFFTDGYLAHTNKYSYDSLNRLIEKHTIYPRERFNEKTVYKLNTEGKLIEKSTLRFDNSLIAKEEFVYDANNVLTEHKFYLPKLCEVTEYIVENQSIKQASVYDMEDGGKLKKVSKYDDNENVIEEEIYNPDGSIKFKFDLKYDGNSRLTEKKRLDSKMNLIEKTTYKYYSDNKLKESCIYNSENKMIEKQEREFDKNGNIIFSLYSNAEENIERRRIYEYKFDENMNWIQRIEILNDTPNEFIERIIKYDID